MNHLTGKSHFFRPKPSIFTFSSLALLLSLLVLYACSTQKSSLSKVKRNFEEEIVPRQNLEFTFEQDLAPATKIGEWTQEPYLLISPKVTGQFKWTDARTLIFSPDAGFAPATDYEAILNADLLNQYNKDLKLEKESYKFHTPYLSIQGAETFWGLSKSGTPQLQMNLRFNYEVNPEDLSRLAKIKLGESELPYQVLSQSLSSIIRIEIKKDLPEEEKRLLALQIAEGLTTPAGTGKAKPLRIDSEIPARDRFNILQVQHQQGNDGMAVRVFTNQAVNMKEAQIKDLITIEPNLVFHIERLDDGFLVKGDFLEGTNYKMTIERGLTGVFGKTLSSDFEQYITLGEVEPSIQFADKKAAYLTSKGEKNIAFRVYGSDEVEMTVYKIYENNLQHFLRESVGLGDYGSSNGYDDYYYGNSNYDNYGDVIYTETLPLKSFKRFGMLYALNMKDIVPKDDRKFKGVYLVKVQSTNKRWIADTKIVAYSDMGFIVKRAQSDDITVFVNSILTAQPIAGASVSLISSSNQKILTAQTNTEGVAVFKNLDKNAQGYKTYMLTAEKDGEFSYMHFSQNPVSTSRYELGGIAVGNYQTFLYGERNLYRPGEKISHKAIVRSPDWKSVGKLPIKWKLTLPNGKTFTTQKAVLNDEGTAEFSLTLPDNAVTGSYTLSVYTSNDVHLESQELSIEEFVPNRIKVETQVGAEQIQAGEKIEVNGLALNLFGPPAVDRKYEAALFLSKESFAPPKNQKETEGYIFTLNNTSFTYFDEKIVEGSTDSEGKLRESFQIASEYQNIGLLRGRVLVTVFDENGRPVRSAKNVDIFTQNTFLGIKPLDVYWVGTNKELRFPLIALDTKGKPKNSDALVKIVRYEWQTVLEKNYYNEYRYVSRRREIIEREQTVRIATSGSSVAFVPAVSGEYEVRLYLQGSESYVADHFYAYAWGATSASSFEVDKEGHIDITLDKPQYNVGETAKVLFKTPFSGKMLVTYEQDKVLQYRYLDVKDRSAALDLPIEAAHLPNLFISATLIRPLVDNSVPLMVAHGYLTFKVEDKPKHHLPLTVSAPAKVRSKTKQTIRVKTETPLSDVEVTIAAVDEGILQIKGYQNPDPYQFFFQKRSLAVYSYDMYKRIFPEFTAQMPSFGADGYDLNGRTNPMANKRVKPVAFWSGTLKTNAQGEVAYDLEIPQFSGDLRIMAVAVKGSQFGSNFTNMKVADPIVLSTGLPRFLSPNDEVVMPLTITNTTDKNAEAEVSIEAGTGLSVIEGAKQTVSINANAEKRVFVRLKAGAIIANTDIKAEVKALGETFSEQTQISIRPSTSLLKEAGGGELKAGTSQTVSLKHDYMAASAKAKLVVSKSPMIQFAKNFDYLVQYPYGCVEQTTSSVFPQLYVQDLSQNLGQALSYNLNPNENIKIAIAKLQSMQLYSGGLSYWQGGTEESWWGTVYATHFMMEAQKAGFQVEKEFFDKAYEYLTSQVKSKPSQVYYYFNAKGERFRRSIPDKATFYSLYILAQAGKQDYATMNFYKANPTQLATDSKYLLALTYKLLGDNASYRKLLPADFNANGDRADNALDGNFYSHIRDQAIVLNMLIEQDPQNSQVPTLARVLSEQLRSTPFLNTQEQAFAFLALGKLARKANAANITATISVGSEVLANFEGKTLKIDQNIAGKELSIKTEGEGSLYYFWEKEGISATGRYVQEDKFLRVRKTFFDRNGKAISLQNLKQNELIVVKVAIEAIEKLDAVQNVVITDILPAGLEIENPRLTDNYSLKWVEESASPDYIDFRDDRINIFTTARAKTQYFYYQARAVTKGKFKMGPISADAMYNGLYRSYHGAAEVVIQ
ncbi:alpha-2-macroglobulin family protein [Hugenholtzia roseola]|uniref:alpha-2-macroglobulin family protein n=1 Tax=Hugenholtzia roseola TaxID=1002 RepID=UPI00041634B2|nr:MG2 domain-containing protein [Hugenholtzia roseola]